jgi:ribosomal protein L29
MTKKRMKDIREKSKEDLYTRITELKADLLRQKTMVKAGGAVENPSKIRVIKKEIARVLTVINERRGKTK